MQGFQAKPEIPRKFLGFISHRLRLGPVGLGCLGGVAGGKQFFASATPFLHLPCAKAGKSTFFFFA
jgi:hypothetical protein